MDIVRFENDAEAFCRALLYETYLQRAGLKDELDLTPIYERFSHLFTVETFHEVTEADREPKYKRFLQEFVAEHFIEAQVKRYSEPLAQAESTALVEWEGQAHSYRAAPVRMMNLGSQDRRHALYEKWLRVAAGLNGLRQERHEASVALARELDFPDYVQLWDELGGLHLADLTEKSGRLLSDTEALYHGELRDQLVFAGVDPADAWKVDLGWVFRAPRFDAYFSGKGLLPSLFRTLADLGLRLEEQQNIKLDTEYREKKTPRAFCAPLGVPEDVRLVILPSGGRTDYDTLFHEAGHAEHFANVDRTQPFAYRRLGDNSVTEAFAFLLQYLTIHPKWLALHLEMDALTDYLRVSLLNKLYMLRRYATKVLYEQRLHTAAGDETMAEVYAELCSEHLGVRYCPEEYLSDTDDAFYAARYLRAWALEAQLRGYLREEFDEEWFRAPRAGKFLVELWREGQKYTAEELLGFMGYDGLDFAPMVDEIRAALGAERQG